MAADQPDRHPRQGHDPERHAPERDDPHADTAERDAAHGERPDGGALYPRPGEVDELADLRPALACGEWCLRTYGVKLVSRLVSRDGRCVVLLYAAPDAESVRMAERHGRRRAAATWAFQWIDPDSINEASGD